MGPVYEVVLTLALIALASWAYLKFRKFDKAADDAFGYVGDVLGVQEARITMLEEVVIEQTAVPSVLCDVQTVEEFKDWSSGSGAQIQLPLLAAELSPLGIAQARSYNDEFEGG